MKLSPNEVGEPIARQLLLIRTFFDDAERSLSVEGDFFAMRAALQLDLAVELALNTLVHTAPHGALDSDRSSKEMDFAHLWQTATQAYRARLTEKTRLPNQDSLARLRQIRNLSQHNGTAPARSEIVRYTEPTREFLAQVFRDYFGASFESFSVCDLVPDERVARFMREAEAMAAHVGWGALASCCIMFDKLVSAIRRAPGKEQSRHELRRVLGGGTRLRAPFEASPALREAFDLLAGQLASIQDEVVGLGLGVPANELARFHELRRRSVRGTVETSGGKWSVSRGDDPSNSEVAFALRFVSRVVYLAFAAWPEAMRSMEIYGYPGEQGFGAARSGP